METEEFIRVANAHAQMTDIIHNIIFFGKSARDDADYLEAKRICARHTEEQRGELNRCLAKYGLDVPNQIEVEVFSLQLAKTAAPIQIRTRASQRPDISTPSSAQPSQQPVQQSAQQPTQQPGPEVPNQIEVEGQSSQQPRNGAANPNETQPLQQPAIPTPIGAQPSQQPAPRAPNQAQATFSQRPVQFRYKIQIPKQKINDLESAARKTVFEKIEEILYSCDDEPPPERPKDFQAQILRISRAHSTDSNCIRVEHIENRDEDIEETCSICYLPFKDPESPTAPKCPHSFCRECLWYWFKTDLRQKHRRYLEQNPVFALSRNQNLPPNSGPPRATRNNNVMYRNPYHNPFYQPPLECPYCRQKITYQAYGNFYRCIFDFSVEKP